MTGERWLYPKNAIWKYKGNYNKFESNTGIMLEYYGLHLTFEINGQLQQTNYLCWRESSFWIPLGGHPL